MPIPIEAIASHPHYLLLLSEYGKKLAALYDENQRLGANLGFQRRWLMSQAALALAWDGENRLTVSNLVEALVPFKVASPNTIRDFVDESVKYGFIEPDPARASIRPRYWRPTGPVVETVAQWLYANLAMLDALDGGDRRLRFAEDPGIVTRLQPRFAWNSLRDPRWREPPARIGLLQRSISGGLVMDTIIIDVGDQPRGTERFIIPAIDAREMAGRILISRTHLQRVLRKVISAGGLGWTGRAFDSDMWVDSAFIDEYCGWQAVKSHYIDEAFEWATRP
ncbi:hypothetical protein [Martelella endophytica]|uniref:hypothetical protein n=1 Tax=Martelella endophytica TaxID=1486262 RepID=UPI000696C5A7|nr:hypothetical protein [Martelella endophytica]